jgi:trans-aconitate 2-methyltransferase
MWDPGLYRQFGAQRSRAFFDLIGRIGVADPAFVADIGCGPGNLTAELCRRWPAAEVIGVDSSPEMIAEAQVLAAGLGSGEGGSRLSFQLADAAAWEPARPVDVLVSNAMLQWIPDHMRLVVRWLDLLADGGWLAFQLPGNDDQPPHRLIRELAGSPRWRPLLGEVKLNKQAADPAEYIDPLARAGFFVEAWETTYAHVLDGEDPVLRWYIGTGLRPVIAALDSDQEAEFLAEYAALLREAYPRAPYGTIFPFRRVFAVAHRA